MTQNGKQRVRLRATTTFVREYETRVREGETVQETLAMEQAIYDEEPIDTAFERYVDRSLSGENEYTLVELADSGPLVLSAEAFDELAAREPGEPNQALVELLRETRGRVIHMDPKSVQIRELEAELNGWRERALEAEVKVARVEDYVDTLGMDRENWSRASRLQDVLDGK